MHHVVLHWVFSLFRPFKLREVTKAVCKVFPGVFVFPTLALFPLLLRSFWDTLTPGQ